MRVWTFLGAVACALFILFDVVGTIVIMVLSGMAVVTSFAFACMVMLESGLAMLSNHFFVTEMVFLCTWLLFHFSTRSTVRRIACCAMFLQGLSVSVALVGYALKPVHVYGLVQSTEPLPWWACPSGICDCIFVAFVLSIGNGSSDVRECPITFE